MVPNLYGVYRILEEKKDFIDDRHNITTRTIFANPPSDKLIKAISKYVPEDESLDGLITDAKHNAWKDYIKPYRKYGDRQFEDINIVIDPHDPTKQTIRTITCPACSSKQTVEDTKHIQTCNNCKALFAT